MNMEDLADKGRALEPAPREKQWSSLTYCVLDAVWSISANYTSVVAPLVRRVAAQHGAPGLPATKTPGVDAADPLPLHAFLSEFPDEQSLIAVTNRQRTSTKGGITKAAAVRQHAEIFLSHGIATLGEAQSALLNPTALQSIDADLRTVPGEGASGIRRGYLWMLIGDDAAIKPDRMVMRWLATNGAGVKNPEEARDVLAQVAQTLQGQYTLWEIDHAIWRARQPSRTRAAK